MTKDDIVSETALHTQVPKNKIATTLDLFLKEVSAALEQHERVEIRRFGSFEVTYRKARVARDLNTNAEIRLPDRAMPRFVPFDAFKNKVSDQFAERESIVEEIKVPLEKVKAPNPQVPDQIELKKVPALEKLEAQVHDSPDDADARLSLVMAYEKSALYDKAIDQCQQILRQEPNHVEAICQMGKMLFMTGAHDRASQDYDRALRINPNHVQTLISRALLRSKIGRYNEAERDLKQVLEYNPETSVACYHLGVLYTKRGLYGRAIQEFEHGLEIDPESADAYFQLGKTYDHLERHADAINMFEALIKIQPNNTRAYWHLGVLYDKTKQSHKALEMYQQSNRLSAAKIEGK
jgi:tetratricopeptide (TPR) repeat protein